MRVQEETRDSGDREETNTSQDNNEMRFWDERALQRAPVQTLCVCVGGVQVIRHEEKIKRQTHLNNLKEDVGD